MVSPVMVALWRVVPPENNMYVPCDPVLRCPNKQQQGQLRGLKTLTAYLHVTHFVHPKMIQKIDLNQSMSDIKENKNRF